MKPLEILHIATTRWLTLRDALERILELWPGLQDYFEAYGTESEKKYFSADNEGSLELLVKKISENFQRDDLFFNERGICGMQS